VGTRVEVTGPPRRRGGPLLLLALCLAATIWAYRALPTLGFTDIDGPTLLRVSRVESPARLLHVLGMEFRDDPRPGVGFYRPLTSLSFAAQQAMGGAATAPLHVVDLLIHLGVGVALFALARRLGLGDWGALLAGAFVLLHPLAAEVVPSIARRGESLAVLFVLIAAWLELAGRRRAALLCALCAPLAKESGFLVFPLLPLLRPQAFGKRRLALFLGAGLALLALRALLLGGWFGGYEERFVAWGALPRALLDLLDGSRILGRWGARLAALVFAALLLARWRDPVVRLGGAWLLAALGLTLFSSGLGAWYLYPALPAIGLLLASFLARRSRTRWVAPALLLLGIAGSPAWIHYPEWEASSRWHARLRDAALAALAPDEVGPVVLAGLPVHQGQGPGHRFHLRSVNVLLGWSLRDAIQLRTGREIEIFGAAHVALAATPAEYRLRARRVGDELEFSLDGPALFSAGDLANERFAARELPFECRVERDRVRLRALRGTVYYWDGVAFVAAP